MQLSVEYVKFIYIYIYVIITYIYIYVLYIYYYILLYIIIIIIIIVIIIILYIHTLIQTVFVLFWWTQMSGTPFFEQGWPASGWATILRGWRSHPRWNLTVGLSLRDIIDIFKEWTRKDATDIVHLYPSRMLLYVCFCPFFSDKLLGLPKILKTSAFRILYVDDGYPLIFSGLTWKMDKRTYT